MRQVKKRKKKRRNRKTKGTFALLKNNKDTRGPDCKKHATDIQKQSRSEKGGAQERVTPFDSTKRRRPQRHGAFAGA